jgi:tetratricopeptide (TPR) repeat protein
MNLPSIKIGGRGRAILAVTVVLFWILVRHQVSQMDERFFQPSLSGIKGLSFYMVGNYSKAAEAYRAHFQKIYQKERSSSDPGLDALLRGDLQIAKEISNEALTKDPTTAGPLLTLGQIALEEESFEQALEFFNRVLLKETEQYDALLLSSVAYARSGAYDKAIDSLKRALPTNQIETRITSFLAALKTTGDLAMRPKGEQPLCLLAYYYRYLRIFDSSNGAIGVAYAMEAIGSGDRVDDAYLTMGVIYEKERKTEKALSALVKAIEVNPGNTEAYSWAGQIYSDRGDLVNEYRMKKAAYEIDPEDPFNVSNYSYFLAEKLGDYRQALILTKKSLEAQPNNPTLVRRTGYLYSFLGNPEEALEYYRKATSLEPQNPSNYEGLGLILSGFEKKEEAKAAFLATLSLDPYRPRAHIGLAHIYIEDHQDREAIKEFEEAFQDGEKDVGQLVSLCSMYYRVSEYEQSAVCSKKVLSMDPNNAQAQQFLSSILPSLDRRGAK